MDAKKAVCCLILSLDCALIPSPSRAQGGSDNASVTAQLNDAKPMVAKIKKDAVQMESYANGGLN